MLESVEILSRNRDLNMAQNLHVCAICLRLEVVYDAISGRYVKSVEGNPLLNFEVASSHSFRDIKQNYFRDGGGGGHRP